MFYLCLVIKDSLGLHNFSRSRTLSKRAPKADRISLPRFVLFLCLLADINGNEYVDWEEFTSFCIELGIVSGKVRESRRLSVFRSESVLAPNIVPATGMSW